FRDCGLVRPWRRARVQATAPPAHLSSDSGAPRHLSSAGHASGHSGAVHRGGKRDAPGQGSDAQVAPAPRTVDPAETAGRLCRRPLAASRFRLVIRESLRSARPTDRSYSIIAFSRATRSYPFSAGIAHARMPSAPNRTGSAAARVRMPLESSGPTKQLIERRERPATASTARTADADN